MNTVLFRSQRTLINGEFIPATLVVNDGVITAIEAVDFAMPSQDQDQSTQQPVTLHDFGNKSLIPGLVDTHCLLYTSPSPRDS